MTVERVHLQPRASTRRRLSVLLCRDCCCGTVRKHPDVDHEVQERLLREAVAAGGGHLRIVNCLDVCARSNVAVVRLAHGQRIWFGNLLDARSTRLLCEWLEEGCASDIPPALGEHVFSRDLEPERSTAGDRI